MFLLDFILNLAALLLWLNWRTLGFARLAPSQGISIARTIRQAGPVKAKRWRSAAALAALLIVRGLLYYQIGSALGWTAYLSFGVTSLPFRSEFLGQMWLYSLFSFGRILFLFYLWLGLLAIINWRADDSNWWQRLVRLHLGGLARLPAASWVALPVLMVALVWTASSPLFHWLRSLPPVASWSHTLEQGFVIGLSALLSWKYLLAGLLLLHVLASYIYFGKAPLWQFVESSARVLLSPLRRLPLILGRFDFAPLVGIALVWAGAELGGRGLAALYRRLPL